MKIRHLLFYIGFFTFFTGNTFAQGGPPKSASSDADVAFASGNFYDAIPLYKKAFSKEKSKDKKAAIVFKTAECYRNISDVPNEIVWYDKAVKAGYTDPV